MDSWKAAGLSARARVSLSTAVWVASLPAAHSVAAVSSICSRPTSKSFLRLRPRFRRLTLLAASLLLDLLLAEKAGELLVALRARPGNAGGLERSLLQLLPTGGQKFGSRPLRRVQCSADFADAPFARARLSPDMATSKSRSLSCPRASHTRRAFDAFARHAAEQ
jgi:hypothetical protein